MSDCVRCSLSLKHLVFNSAEVKGHAVQVRVMCLLPLHCLGGFIEQVSVMVAMFGTQQRWVEISAVVLVMIFVWLREGKRGCHAMVTAHHNKQQMFNP